MPEYTVKSAVKKKELVTQYGAQVVYLIELEGEALAVELLQKADTKVPGPGDKLNGSIEQTQYGPKFKKEYSPAGRPGGGYQPRNEKAIVRQHSQQMALMYFQVRGQTSFSDEDLRARIDWFAQDAAGADPKPQAVTDATWNQLGAAAKSFATPAEFNNLCVEQIGHVIKDRDDLLEDEAQRLLAVHASTCGSDYDPFENA